MISINLTEDKQYLWNGMIALIKVGFLVVLSTLYTLGIGQDFHKEATIPDLSNIMKNNPFSELNVQSDTFISSLLANNANYFSSIIENREAYGVQVFYTQIDRKRRKKLILTDHTYELNADHYFYPASTVKLPVAILALQKLRELNIRGLDMNATMITGAAGFGQTEVCNDPTAPDGRPTIAHYIKKILLVSDNDAFNRLYEFLGQEYINHSLHKMGYKEVQIIHRLSISLSEEQNRRTNPVSFLDIEGKALFNKYPEYSQLKYADRNTKMGTGYLKDNELIQEPFDFSKKNRLSLQDLHLIVRSVIYPELVPKENRFNLSKEDYEFLRKYMSMKPEESQTPVYPATDYWDNYAKFLYYGAEKGSSPTSVRIFNKVGNAYGFLTDAAYIADFANNIEFFLSAVIYCNSDGVFNDDKYDYNTIGYPFLKNLGKVIYEYELKRDRKKAPDLSKFSFKYKE